MSQSAAVMDGDIEAVKSLPERIPYWHLILDKAPITQAMLDWKYEGTGTESDPFLVSWIDNDPRNPHSMSTWRKWLITCILSIATLAVAFNSSSYSGSLNQVIEYFHVSAEVCTLGLSLYVLGFAVGPILWAPLCEMYGRQPILFITFAVLTVFNAGCAGAQNIQTLIILRFFAGIFGASPLTNAGAVIADMFTLSERGFAMSLFATAPFLGPVLGPIVGGFLGQSEGWRWVEGVASIFTGVLWILGAVLIPETFAPVILQRRAEKLSAMTGKFYVSKGQLNKGNHSAKEELTKALCRPWQLMFHEPIVLFLSMFMSIVYGTLYLFFGALPIVYQEKRGWNQGEGGLAFLGIAVGMSMAVAYSIFDSGRFAARATAGRRPEDRLSGAKIGSVVLPVSLFWFAWTNSPSIPWPASNYLVDAYTIYAASVLAATVISRSFFGAAFPLFTTQMYHNLGIHWATMIPAFLSLACMPLPFLFYTYGERIRSRCKYAARAQAYLKSLSIVTPTSEPNIDSENKDEGLMDGTFSFSAKLASKEKTLYESRRLKNRSSTSRSLDLQPNDQLERSRSPSTHITPNNDLRTTMSSITPSSRMESSDADQVQSITESQSYLQLCQQIANGQRLPSPGRMLGIQSPGREVIDYHSGRHYISILGGIITQDRARRLTRLVIEDHKKLTGHHELDSRGELAGLDDADISFLHAKGAFNFPPKAICDALLRLHFELVFPYAPVIDRLEFMRTYEAGTYSSFLVNAMLAASVPYAPLQLLIDAGFTDRLTAVRKFSSNAVLLYDFGCEKSQLRRLQGSIILGVGDYSYTTDKDFRYWFYNAARIATRMGLHRNDIAEDMDPATYKVCRRIWWVLYSRGVLLLTFGLENMQILHNSDSDTDLLVESDWDEKEIPNQYTYLISSVTRAQKLYIIENSKLASIGAQFVTMYQRPKFFPSRGSENDLADKFSMWRQSLPEEFQAERIQSWSNYNMWILLLLAVSYRLECIFYRTLQKRYKTENVTLYDWATQRLWSCMFELDTIIGRAVTHDIIDILPMSFINCVSTVLALYIETALDPSVPTTQKTMAPIYIRSNMIVLKRSQERIPMIKWSVRLFEWVVAYKSLLRDDTTVPEILASREKEVEQYKPINTSLQTEGFGSTFANDIPGDLIDASGLFQDCFGFDFLDSLNMPQWET
ncbi:hypothetical protein B7463_g7554, partial [Scytalidium lignicola]